MFYILAIFGHFVFLLDAKRESVDNAMAYLGGRGGGVYFSKQQCA